MEDDEQIGAFQAFNFQRFAA